MKRFRFRLQSLFDLARKREEAARRELAQALEQFRNTELRVEEATIDLEQAREEVRRSAGGKALDPERLLGVQVWVLRREAALGKACVQRDLAAAGYEEKHRALAECRREAMALERARDDAYQDWKVERDRDELAGMEEATIARRRKDGDES